MTVKRLIPAVLIALGLSFALGPAEAQREPYGGFPRTPAPQGQRTHVAGQFDYYVLSMSWSPSYCAGLTRGGYDPQCHRRDGKRYSFVLHGLWPQYERGWPESCQSGDRGFVPRPVADRMLDIMPSDKLVFHEYRKHGTCSGLGVDGYFDLSRKLFGKVKVPARYVDLNDARVFVSPDELIREFLALNPGIKPDGIAVECGGPGNRLKEVRVCFDRQGEFRTCGRNENQRRMCSADRMYVPPVRQSAPTLQERIKQLVPGTGQRI
jgi:ribonuclease T2